MQVKVVFEKAFGILAVPDDNVELLKAQYHAFSRQMPLMYLVLLSSTWAVAITHLAIAPLWLTIVAPIALTLISVVRVSHWRRSRYVEPTAKAAQRALTCVNYLAFAKASVFTGWSLLLFPYGDAYTRSHLAFYMAITVISCIFGLVHLRSAAVIVTVIVNGAFIFFFAATCKPTFVAMAINIAVVSIGILTFLSINSRDFAKMVNAETETRRKREEQSRLLRMIDEMPVAVMTVDPKSLKIVYVNETSRELIRKIEHLLPIDAENLIGTSIDVFHRDPEHQRRILTDPKNLPHNARIQLGPEVLDLKASAVMADDGSFIGPMLTWALITKEVEAESRISQLAHNDALTGLPNRATFHEGLCSGLAAANKRLGLLYIDLDGFKHINDTRGHPVGDEVLCHVARRLLSVCHAPGLLVGRLGGDEFAVLVPHGHADRAVTFARDIIEALKAPYELDHDITVQLGASVGIAFAPEHGEIADILFSRADMALYAAKTAGKGRVHIFSQDMEIRAQERARLEGMLRRALDTRTGLFVFYQPIVDVETGRLTAREALIRWHTAENGWIPPCDFVPIAEEAGLIDQLGAFVLGEACRDAVERDDGARVAVNISASQLGNGTLAEMVLSVLLSSGLAPNRLEVEVTETALLGAEATAIHDLRRLRDMGVRVALDDFGTGYSSLTHLRIFPFDTIKIDGSFVKEAVDHRESAAVVKAIADLGKRLGVNTVAEGVETQEQLERIRREGCTEFQGYLFGRPAPSERDVHLVEELNKGARSIAAA